MDSGSMTRSQTYTLRQEISEPILLERVRNTPQKLMRSCEGALARGG